MVASKSRYYYYYVDPACDAKCYKATGQPLAFYVHRAQEQAARALARLRDRHDTDFARVFNVIMKTPRGDRERLPRSGSWQCLRLGFRHQPKRHWRTTMQHVARDLSTFAHRFRPSSDRKAAHVRFFSDNGERWVQDGPHLYDPVNHIIHNDRTAPLSLDQASGACMHPEGEARADENPDRFIIDFGERCWREIRDEKMYIQSRGDLSKVHINDLLVTSLSRLIFHEMMHGPPFHLDDIPHAGETAMWGVVMASRKGDAHRNAESMAALGFWASLADTIPAGWETGGYTLDRSWDQIPGSSDDVKHQASGEHLLIVEERKESVYALPEAMSKWSISQDNPAARGVLVPYADLTGQP
ncbi:hypothetical protein M406DRAFT_330460 [Cryphonectria parasitica EP155]|uniref:Uncharacterized protein n=1 Tax=Cryphonectria parasitica (strain ATCC 38755 / EP155) TaxID=660469 RepID=A0A9P4Y051_CRYP1|nr:uncharacterized protein M406DRAFT_330460 [Cryphonectria parasitica EP155]KAF3764111.1 hypothetical protein M406DRAFT_330460 [Cryphonectria parasitica EP155]